MQTQPSILIVDDNVDFLKITNLILKSHGYRSQCASSVVEAAIILEQSHPDLMILDINLNGEDGREFCESLKNRSGNDSMKVIMISGYEEDLGSIAWSGAHDFLQKPFEMDDLISKINFHLMNKRLNTVN
jgi:DNA-binding response OmpR family regulator